ncbi:MAG: hypothetical protein KDD89_01690 [Anaerolineales bacterium]|nr:hypothetical protein [Anaerolineales bacterium]
MTFRTLNAEILVERIAVLQHRIAERFPTRNLNKVCAELLAVAEETRTRTMTIRQPIWPLRLAVGTLVVVFATAAMVAIPKVVLLESTQFGLSEFLQALEAGTNNILLIGAALLFLVTAERRIKQKRTLAALHELRVLAHVIDMYQLTKDPERIIGRGPRTASSPKENMTAFELTRYLNYCGEMLSLIGKIAALYVQDFDDEVAVAAVNELEDLTTALSSKIWQKIVLLHSLELDGASQIEIAKR